MRAMLLDLPGTPLRAADLPDPEPGPGEVRIRVSACGVCRTDLHVVDGDLPPGPLPIVPGHEIVGRIDRLGDGVADFAVGEAPILRNAAAQGRVVVYSGRTRERLCTLANDVPGVWFGAAIAVVGDVDGDGHGDVIVWLEGGLSLRFGGPMGLSPRARPLAVTDVGFGHLVVVQPGVEAAPTPCWVFVDRPTRAIRVTAAAEQTMLLDAP